jgi:hypothetical protein
MGEQFFGIYPITLWYLWPIFIKHHSKIDLEKGGVNMRLGNGWITPLRDNIL